MKQCAYCSRVLPFDAFGINPKTKTEYVHCKTCKPIMSTRQKNYKRTDGTCWNCQKVKPLSDFPKRVDGVPKNICNICSEKGYYFAYSTRQIKKRGV